MNDAIDSKEVSLFIVKNLAAKIHKYYVDFMCWSSIFFSEGGEGPKIIVFAVGVDGSKALFWWNY